MALAEYLVLGTRDNPPPEDLLVIWPQVLELTLPPSYPERVNFSLFHKILTTVYTNVPELSPSGRVVSPR